MFRFSSKQGLGTNFLLTFAHSLAVGFLQGGRFCAVRLCSDCGSIKRLTVSDLSEMDFIWLQILVLKVKLTILPFVQPGNLDFSVPHNHFSRFVPFL